MTKYVVGRKEYVCNFCGKKIFKGERHFYNTMYYTRPGHFEAARLHIKCLNAVCKRNKRPYLGDKR